MSAPDRRALEESEPALMRAFVKMVLRGASAGGFVCVRDADRQRSGEDGLRYPAFGACDTPVVGFPGIRVVWVAFTRRFYLIYRVLSHASRLTAGRLLRFMEWTKRSRLRLINAPPCTAANMDCTSLLLPSTTLQQYCKLWQTFITHRQHCRSPDPIAGCCSRL
jgi:hypothetical protein